MKRLIPILLCLLLLCGCSERGSVREVTAWGVTFTVDTEAHTVSDGRYQYSYKSADREVTITYPNGATYWASFGTVGASGGSKEYDDSILNTDYEVGEHLVEVVKCAEGMNRPHSGKNVFIGIVLIVFGALYACFPGFLWKIRYGIWMRNVEATQFALIFARVCGVIIMIAGIVMLFL